MPLNFDNTEVAFSHLTDKELKKAYYVFKLLNNNVLSTIGKRFTLKAFEFGLPIKNLVKTTIFSAFVGGETLQESEDEIDLLNEKNVGVILDYGVEAKNEEVDLDATADAIINIITQINENSRNNIDVCAKITAFAPNELLEKVSCNEKLTAQEQQRWDAANHRIDRVCKTAWEHNIKIYIDAEETWLQTAINQLVETMMSRYNRDQCIVLNTIQLYTKNGYHYLQNSYETAQANNYHLGVKLVRGAYMEKERARAKKHGYASPIQDTKKDTDTDFNRAIEFCIERIEHITFCIASHNEDSNYLLNDLLERQDISKQHPNILIAQLFGMGDHITFNMANHGFNTYKYLPYGPVKELLPYLLRRANENSSVDGQATRELTLHKKELKRRAINVLL